MGTSLVDSTTGISRVVKNAKQYTCPVEAALEAVRSGSMPELTTRQKHTRLVYVVAEEGADKAYIENAIKTMPNYFDEYDTTVNFISEEEFNKNHSGLAHGGFVIRTGKTGMNKEHTHVIEYSLKLDSNPEFTTSVLVAYARAALRMKANDGKTGCFTVLDVPPAYLSTLSDDDLKSSSSGNSDESHGSSSSDNLKSELDAKIKPSGTYDCSKYSCITTKYLNQEFLKLGKYGEILDERDNQVYKTIQIKDQVWLAQNLNLRYTQATAELDSSSFCYDNSPGNCKEYGRLYLWSATMDSAGVYSQKTVGCGYQVYCNSDEKVRGICPDGFHVPNRNEWATLFENTGGLKDKGYSEFEMVKSTALNNDTIWADYYKSIGYGYTPRKDEYGFAALPAGKATSSGAFKDIGELTYIWSSTDLNDPEDGSWHAYAVGMYFYETNFINSFAGNGKYGRRSIRCVKD